MASGSKRRHPAIRALALLAETPDDPAKCWTTTAANTTRPSIGVGRYKTVRTARVVLEAKLGRPLKPGMQALHTCDHPPCIRPDHLFEGTQTDNLRDMAAKLRGNTAKLTHEQTAEVLGLVRQGWAKADVARAYDVTPPRVCQLARQHG